MGELVLVLKDSKKQIKKDIHIKRVKGKGKKMFINLLKNKLEGGIKRGSEERNA